MHWAAKYIGLPYEAGARGPDKVDCWGLVHLAYEREFGLTLPLYPGISLEKPIECTNTIQHGLRADWIEVTDPFDGALIAMSQRTEIHHIGLYAAAERGWILHCWKAQQVIADTLRGLKMRGMRVIKFYRYRIWPTS